MRVLLLCCALLIAALAPRAHAQADDIRSVISGQIEAFKADDFDSAFDFAHPTIQNIFRNPENFGRMVREGYPMVWRPAEVDYLPLREENGRVLQDLRVVDAEGRVFLLEYQMRETADGWRISGVRILEQSTLSA